MDAKAERPIVEKDDVTVEHRLFSIIVPTYNRRDVVVGTLASIAAARRPGPCEVIVVIDGSSDGTAEAITALDLDLPVTVITQENRGAAAARNTGAAAAQGELLLFLDDDMTVDENLLYEHAKALRAGADVVVGHVLVDSRSPINVLRKGVERWADQRKLRLDAAGGKLSIGDFLSGQLSVRAGYFAKVRGFDGTLTAQGTFGGEDTDLVYRLLQAGAEVRFSSAAVSYQRYIVTAEQNMQQWIEAGRADAMLSRKHPGLGALLHDSHGGDSLLGRATRALAVLPENTTQAIRDRLVRRVDQGRMDMATEYAFAKLRDVAYWRGARRAGGLDASADAGVRILAYHAIEEVDDPRIAQYSVSPALFEEQIDALLDAGHTFIGTDDLLAHLEGRPLPPRSVLLTFDDAYESLLTNAAPILERRGIVGVACVVADEIGGHNAWDAATGATQLPLMTAEQLTVLRDAGWEIASHSRRHAHLTTLPGAVLRGDLRRSRDVLLRLGLGAPRLLAYPYGEHDVRVRDQTRKAGFLAAFALTTGQTGPVAQARYALARIEVQQDTTPADLLRLIGQPDLRTTDDVLRRELRGLASAARSTVLGRRVQRAALPAAPAQQISEGATR
ncbi:glycosyltransferase [Micromonosporaceae bacterium Da 78-11]